MNGWLILLGILLFFLLLLLIPVHLDIEYDGELRVNVRYLFIKYPLYPPRPKKEKKPKKKKEKPEEKKEKPKKENAAVKFVREHGIDAVIEILKAVVDIIKNLLGSTSRHLVIDKLVINAIIVGSDSADTALKYAYACSAVYPMVSFLKSNAHLRRHSEDISAGFLFEKTIVEFIFHSRIRPYWLVGMGVSALAKLIAGVVRAFSMKAQPDAPEEKKPSTN